MKNNKRRWSVLFGAIILQICLGSIYTWSLFNEPISKAFNWEIADVVQTFAIAIFFFALSTILSGKLLKKIGARKVATIGGLLYGTGVLLTSFATSLPQIYLTYGVVGGIGVGFAYVCPLTTLVKWFPDKKGTITGIAVGAFGLGSVIFKPLIQMILELNKKSPMQTFLYLGIIYLVLCFIAAQLFREPEEHGNAVKTTTANNEYTVSEMIKTKSFYIILILFFLGCIPGLLAIGLAKNIGLGYVGTSAVVAGNTVVLIAVFNTVGRMGSGALADKFGFKSVITGLFLISVIAVVILIFASNSASTFMLYASLAGIAVGFGGLLAVVPALVGEYYGSTNLGVNYSIIFQAYGISALVGPQIAKILLFKELFYVSAIVAVVGLFCSIILKKPKKA